MNNFNDNIKQVVKDFNDVFLQVLENDENFIFDIHKTEYLSTVTTDVLDIQAGIDLLLINQEDGGCVGASLRIQTVIESFFTFTIRCKTDNGGYHSEYQKRSLALDNKIKGYLYPQYIFQGYMTNDRKFLNLAMAKTEDVINLVDKNYIKPGPRGALFYIVDWKDIKNIKIWN